MMKFRINTFIIGVQKSATTSLHDWMIQHPDIYGPIVMKDYHFFSNDKYYNKGITHLHSFYTKCKDEKVIVNGAVNYSYFSRIASKRIYDYNHDARFVMVLRNPVNRAYSAYRFFKKNQEETADSFQQAIENEKKLKSEAHEILGRFMYLDHGYYSKQIKEFLKHFDKSRFHFILYEEMMKDEKKVIKDLFDFLDIDSDFVPDFNKVNVTGSAKSHTVQKWLYTEFPLKRALKKLFFVDRWLSLEAKTRIGFWIRNKNTLKGNKRTYEKMDTELYKVLLEGYKKDILELETLIDHEVTKYWR